MGQSAAAQAGAAGVEAGWLPGALQAALRGGHTLHPLVVASGSVEGAAECLERRLGDMVGIAAAVLEEVEVHPGVDGDRLKELVDELGVEGRDPAAGEIQVLGEERP